MRGELIRHQAWVAGADSFALERKGPGSYWIFWCSAPSLPVFKDQELDEDREEAYMTECQTALTVQSREENERERPKLNLMLFEEFTPYWLQ